MDFLSIQEVGGDQISLKRTDPRHFYGSSGGQIQGKDGRFGKMLINSLNEVNALQQEHTELSVRAITDPDSVDPHDVTIAAAKATTSLSLAKTVIDRVIRAYNDIVNVR